jgi:alpha-mannosidase
MQHRREGIIAPTKPAVRVRITVIRTPEVGFADANRIRLVEVMSNGHAVHVVEVTLTPHTHWDREWYEPFAVFSERLVVMMDALLDLAESGFPHFHLDGQTAMIDDYLERRPERAADLRRHVRAGRLSAGPWVTQMDEFLTSGESHIRNLEMGMARAEALGGGLRLGYMPDQFGHIGQMPQMLRMAGLDRAMVWRGVPRAIDRSSFRWRSPDGSEVLTEYMVFGYFNGASFAQATDPGALADAIRRSIDAMRPYTVGDAMVVMVGYDHAGPDATLPERLEQARRFLPRSDVRIAGLGPSVAAAGRDVSGDLPVWVGELRSSARAHLLPNVYSARVHQKLERGRVEILLERVAEPLAALVPGLAWPHEALQDVWTLMLWNGAHDSACGCSHDQVALDVDARFASARATAESIAADGLRALGAQVHPSGTIRWNPSPFEREGIAGLGYRVEAEPLTPELVPVSIEPLPDGSGIAIDGVGVRLLDETDVGDLYNFCPAEREQRVVPPEAVEVVDGGVRAAWPGLRVRVAAERRTDEPFVRLTGVIDNERLDHRLRMHVDLRGSARGSLAGSPFELVARPLVGEGSDAEAASPTWPARHVVAAGDIVVLHEGVFEYEVVDGRELAVALLRCVGWISAEVLATRPWQAGPQTPTPAAQMIGETTFSLGVWAGAPIGDHPALLDAWERFAVPIVEAPAIGGGDRPAAGTLLTIDPDGAQLSNVRRVGDRREVRLWNPWPDRALGPVIGGRRHTLGPARIETVELGR